MDLITVVQYMVAHVNQHGGGLANAAASIVIHKLGTTGTASIPELRKLLL